MEPTQPPSKTEVRFGEDSKPTGDLSLSDSIVNVEKEELLDDAVVEEEAHKDSDSVVSGGDEAGGDGDGDGGGEYSSEEVELLEKLAKSFVILRGQSGSCDVCLIGTSHVSQKSCQVVQALISFLKPEVVLLELCSSRESLLQPQTMKVPTMSDMLESWKQGQNTFGILYSWFLAKIGNELEVLPGSEFRVAYEEALKYGGTVMFIDRPVQVTLERTMAKLTLWDKLKLIYALMSQPVFSPSSEEHDRVAQEVDTADTLTQLIEELGNEFPSLMETFVHERDQYMATTMLEVARKYSSVVAVVGRMHVNGIKKNWLQPVPLDDLKTPSNDSVFTAKRIFVVAVAGTALVTGILLSRRR